MSGWLQVNNCSGSLQMENSDGPRTVNIGEPQMENYRRRTTVVGLRWRTLVVGSELHVK